MSRSGNVLLAKLHQLFGDCLQYDPVCHLPVGIGQDVTKLKGTCFAGLRQRLTYVSCSTRLMLRLPARPYGRHPFGKCGVRLKSCRNQFRFSRKFTLFGSEACFRVRGPLTMPHGAVAASNGVIR